MEKPTPSLRESELPYLRATLDGMMSASPHVDKFSTWLLGLHGATVALLVANLKDLQSVLTQFELKTALALLIAGGLFGFAQKELALSIRTGEERYRRIMQLLNVEFGIDARDPHKIIDASGASSLGIDIHRIMWEASQSLPW